MKRWLHWLLHFWVDVTRLGAHVYQRCSVCHARRAVRLPGRYGPVDELWIKTGLWDARKQNQRPR